MTSNQSSAGKIGAEKLLALQALMKQSTERQAQMVSSAQPWERERNAKAFYESQDEIFQYKNEAGDVLVMIEEDSGADIGARVWDVAIVAAKYCEKNASMFLGKRFIEIGAGTGILGLVMAFLGAKSIILTDLPRVLPILDKQVALNAELFEKKFEKSISSVVNVRELTWGKELEAYEGSYDNNIDYILLSDMAAPVMEVPPLIATLKKLLELNKNAVVFMVQSKIRELTPVFFEQSKDVFDIKFIPDTEWNPSYNSDRCMMCWIKLKQT